MLYWKSYIYLGTMLHISFIQRKVFKEQIINNRLAMGSQHAPLLSNIWLTKFNPLICENCKIFERYMDDILMSIKKDLIEVKLHFIKELHPNLRFTIEIEKDGKIPFLDICIDHEGNSLTTKWYTKPTDTGLVLNFHALAPKRYKRNAINGELHRSKRIASDYGKEIINIRENFLKADYPIPFINSVINQLNQQNVHNSKENEDDFIIPQKIIEEEIDFNQSSYL